MKLIADSKLFCVGLDFNESDFLLDILKTVPLFSQDGNYYRWSHKSLQEYFAAQFIYLDSKEKQAPLLKKIYAHPNLEIFLNVLDLYYDMDYKTFRNTIEYELLRNYEEYISKFYLDANDNIDQQTIIKRKELTFLMDSFIFKADRVAGVDPFEGENLSNMVHNLTKKENLNSERFSAVLIGSFSNLYCLSYQSPQNTILHLLLNKKNPIVKNIYSNSQEDIEIEHDFVNNFEPKKVIDYKKDIFNVESNFNKVNSLMEATRIHNISINHIEALKKLKIIQQSLTTESEDDFLLGGI